MARKRALGSCPIGAIWAAKVCRSQSAAGSDTVDWFYRRKCETSFRYLP